MRGVNFRMLLANYRSVVDKLCDELSTHDILCAIKENLARKVCELEKNKFSTEKTKLALKKLDEVLELIDPEQL